MAVVDQLQFFRGPKTSGPQSPLGEREASQQPARPQHSPLLSLPSPGHRHRRARSEVAFRLPDHLGLGGGGGGGPDSDAFDEIGSEDDLFSTFMDIEKISSSGPSNRDRDCAAETSSPLRPKHRHISSVDGSGLFFSPSIGGGAGKDAAASLAEVMEAKKAMTPEQLAELAAIDPKRAKRCAGVDMATLPSELALEELSGQEADQQSSKHTTSRSVNVKKSLLVKRMSSAVNAPKPPTEKRRKSSASNVQFVRSPLLNRIVASPRMRHSRAKHQRSPCVGLSSSTLPDDTRTTASPNLGKDAASRSVDRIKSLLSKRKSSVVNASNHSERMQRKSSASRVHYVRSLVLNRMLQSPRMSQSPVLSARSSSSSSSDDTRMVISPDLGPTDLDVLENYTGTPFLPSDSDILLDSPDQDDIVEYFADAINGSQSYEEKS